MPRSRREKGKLEMKIFFLIYPKSVLNAYIGVIFQIFFFSFETLLSSMGTSLVFAPYQGPKEMSFFLKIVVNMNDYDYRDVSFAFAFVRYT